jgi:hypothetical protein
MWRGDGSVGRDRGFDAVWLRCSGGGTRRVRLRDVVVRRRAGDRGTLDGRAEHGVEACDELGVAIADEETEVSSGIFEIGSEVTGHLGDPGTVGVGGDAEQVHPSSLDLDHEEHVEAPEENCVDGEEVGCQDSFGLGAQELAPSRTEAPWRGWETMARRRTVATLVLETMMPSFLSSPTMRRYPQRGFSRASRTISSTVSCGRAGRPGFRWG